MISKYACGRELLPCELKAVEAKKYLIDREFQSNDRREVGNATVANEDDESAYPDGDERYRMHRDLHLAMIRHCTENEFDRVLAIINEAAQVYKGIIPDDRWKDPYMPAEELADEITAGVIFHGYEIPRVGLVGVMGVQFVKDVALIRHAYVVPEHQRSGIGSALLMRQCVCLDCPVLVGTWADAKWAIVFYQRHGFKLVPMSEKSTLLKKYWTISDRQIETSVVLADAKWYLTP